MGGMTKAQHERLGKIIGEEFSGSYGGEFTLDGDKVVAHLGFTDDDGEEHTVRYEITPDGVVSDWYEEH